MRFFLPNPIGAAGFGTAPCALLGLGVPRAEADVGGLTLAFFSGVDMDDSLVPAAPAAAPSAIPDSLASLDELGFVVDDYLFLDCEEAAIADEGSGFAFSASPAANANSSLFSTLSSMSRRPRFLPLALLGVALLGVSLIGVSISLCLFYLTFYH